MSTMVCEEVYKTIERLIHLAGDENIQAMAEKAQAFKEGDPDPFLEWEKEIATLLRQFMDDEEKHKQLTDGLMTKPGLMHRILYILTEDFANEELNW